MHQLAKCPQCKRTYKYSPNQLGKRCSCNGCGAIFNVGSTAYDPDTSPERHAIDLLNDLLHHNTSPALAKQPASDIEHDHLQPAPRGCRCVQCGFTHALFVRSNGLMQCNHCGCSGLSPQALGHKHATPSPNQPKTSTTNPNMPHDHEPLTPIQLWSTVAALSILVVSLYLYLFSYSANDRPLYNPPLTFPDAPHDAPGAGASEREWRNYYQSPEGQEQLLRDIASLEKQLDNPNTRRRINDILNENGQPSMGRHSTSHRD